MTLTEILLLPVQETDPTSPDLRQETLIPSRDQIHWDHTFWRERGATTWHETGDVIEQVLDNLLG